MLMNCDYHRILSFLLPHISEILQTGIETCQSISRKESDLIGRACKDISDRDTTITLLRKEIELALDSLREVQVQMAKLLKEKEEIRMSEIQSQKSMECITAQVLRLQAETDNTGKQSNLKMAELELKLFTVEERMQEARSYWRHKKEVAYINFVWPW